MIIECFSVRPVTNKIEFEVTIIKVDDTLYDIWAHVCNITLDGTDMTFCIGTFNTFDGAVQACLKNEAIMKIHLRN